jgi:DNA-binding ferritin-like protein
METEILDDVLRLQQEFSDKLAAQMRRLEQAPAGTLDEMMAEKRAMLKRSQADMDAVSQAREEAVKRFDDDLRRHKETIAQLESDIKEFGKAKRPSAKTKTVGPRAKRKRTPAKKK